jgi:hypothetical protein
MNNNLEKVGYESFFIENNAMILGILENINMYTNGIFEMANYQTEESGLPYEIWFDDVGKNRIPSHNIPRIKIKIHDSGNFIPISINKYPKILLKGMQLRKAENELKGKNKEIMFNFISKNHELILQHWSGNITTAMLFSRLKSQNTK